MDDSKKKISFIINPISGTQGKEQILKWLDEKLDKSRYIPEVIYTERAGHAVEIAALKAKEEAFAVVAIGGDGTINEIARSLVHTKTALGIIPCGSGNGLARHLQIPMDAKKAINIINEGLIDIIDYGKINAALTDLWDALTPFAINIGEGLLWFWENVLVPLGTWTANEVVPRFLETLSSVISILNAILEALKPLFKWFWDTVLLPVAKWTAGAFLEIWDGIRL